MDIARAGVEPIVVKFYRQYMQQINELSYPPGSLLINPDVQSCLYKYFFDASKNAFLPVPRYQAKVLRHVITEIEKSMKDPDEDQVSDKLYEHLGYLSAIPSQAQSEDAEQLHVQSYYPPLPLDERGVQPILIKEARNLLSKGNNVGLRTWEAAMHLGWYLFTQRLELVGGKNVLELGAGTGFLSVFCAGQLKAASVLATDGLSLVCESLRANVNLNLQNNTFRGSKGPEVLELDWTDRLMIEQLLEDARKSSTNYDLVLGADVTYHPDILRPLAELLSILKDNFPDVAILISAAIRSDTYSQFKAICQNEFNFKVIEQSVVIPDGLRYSGFFHTVATPLKVVSLER